MSTGLSADSSSDDSSADSSADSSDDDPAKSKLPITKPKINNASLN